MMSAFNRLFAELFKKKSRKIHLLIILQLVSAIALTVFMLVIDSGWFYATDPSKFGDDWLTLTLCFFTISFLFLPIYLIISCSETERLNRSQTWRLAPVSDISFYLDNTLSSFVSYIYLGILQLIGTGIFFLATLLFNPEFLAAFKKLIPEIQNNAYQFVPSIYRFLCILAMIILLGLLVYLVTNFLNFVSQAVLDFLPGISSKFSINLIRLILIVALIWALAKAWNLISPLTFMNNVGLDEFLGILLLFIIDIVFLMVNTFIFSKFFEAKQNK
ncbi:hypothetical protein [Lactobacillus sp. ESL0681]|uniref:hypothetical protein n=1 Tax=Lactobacillus sp. ESL0681 TaxID=2983211 RepID=UPI0023F6A09B|nr:hypothetical protein [Lactobacillus sp. ESL0681]WEV40709.1 hypothetical protein OZX59_02000 [Lactobacillus sp. ESL0681]